jgi:acetylornithine aminotransferase/acetylornithine/N-succinyldiaminopimelate aminotransferase
VNVPETESRFQLPTYKKLPLVLEKGEGVYVFDAEGRRYLDLYGGHAVATTGHSHTRIAEAIARQARQLIFYSNVVYSPARAEAASRLLATAGEPYHQVFFVNSGAEANEAALRIARRASGRRKVVALEGSFHGRTLGAASVTGLGKYRPAGPNPDVEFIPAGDSSAAERAIDNETAAVILEPIQSMAGVREPEPAYFTTLRQATKNAGAFLIFDEVQTGGGRVGSYLYSGLHGVSADLVTLAKGIASGVPMGAVLVTREVASTVASGDLGSTFGGGPLASAALVATLEVLEGERIRARVEETSAWLRKQLAAVPGVEEVRGRGLLLGLRLRRPAAEVQKALLDQRIITGTSDDPAVLRLLPPLTLQVDEVRVLVDVLPSVL